MRFIRSSHSRTNLRPGRKVSPARTAGCVRSQERERERERENSPARPAFLNVFSFPDSPPVRSLTAAPPLAAFFLSNTQIPAPLCRRHHTVPPVTAFCRP